ncbi:MAG: ORF6N domain-containing protein [Candidatus Moranbacteria bacterium]|nr:ORF6N domain-containing protein [Candidatus Moranbacteria bacterium]
MAKNENLRFQNGISSAVPDERIISQIYFIRGEKVMFSSDLATLYGVEMRALNQAVRRNIERFPEDFAFELNKKEFEIWKSQIVTSNPKNKNLKSQFVISSWGGHRKPPLVFTEQGVAMLSAVLKSKRAVAVSIQIVRTFVKLREILSTHKQLREKVELMEDKYDKSFKVVFQMIARLMKEDTEPRKKIGFCDRNSDRD